MTAMAIPSREQSAEPKTVNQHTRSDYSIQVTRLLAEIPDRGEAASELMPLVYEQLHAIARQRMREERAAHTLQATALVHEAYMRLVGDAEISWQSRGHFFRMAAEAMRRILIDHARKRKAQKRGGGKSGLPISVVDLASVDDPDRVLALDEALTTLEEEDPRAAQIVQLRFFAGLSVDDTAESMGISRRTVMREWAFARARLFELLDAD